MYKKVLLTKKIDKSRWLSALVAAVGAPLIFALAGMIELPAPPSLEKAVELGKAPELVLTRLDTVRSTDALGERLRLFDPTPLFLPVSGDGFMTKAEALRDSSGGEVVRLFPPRLRYDDGGELTHLLCPPAPTTLAAAVELARLHWFNGLTRTMPDEAGSAAVPAGARVKVFRFGTGELVSDKAFAVDPGLAEGGWRPLKLMMLVNEVGAVGSPSIIAGSGVDEVDEKVRSLIGREWGRALRLRPGNYRLEISL